MSLLENYDAENVVLPEGTRIIWSATHGASFWAISTKIDTEDAQGNKQSYFMKVQRVLHLI